MTNHEREPIRSVCLWQGHRDSLSVRIVVVELPEDEAQAERAGIFTIVEAMRIDAQGDPSWYEVKRVRGHTANPEDIVIEAFVDRIGRPEWDKRERTTRG